jgi:dephospho-CoA kinase
MLKVGLTGGIATGKTHVLARMAAAGFRTLDLDAVSREVMAPGGSAYAEVAAAFGPTILAAGGAIDRTALGRIVFADAGLRRRLEAIVHPRVREVESRVVASAGADEVVVVDAALLVEAGSHLRYDRLAVVYCDPQEQLCRLMARDGLTESAARARIDAQMPVDEKRRFGHHVVDTSGSVADTDARADDAVRALRAVASRPRSAVRIPADAATAMMERGPHEGPRGLAPWRLAGAIAAWGTLDLARLTAELVPPHQGPWYLAPLERPDHPPESLAVPVALWSAARRPLDVPFAVAAAASLARLTHRGEDVIAGAVVAALAAQHVLAEGGASAVRRELPGWVRAAREWTGVAPRSAAVDTVAAAGAHAGDREGAARAAQIAGGLAPLARALAGGPPASVAAGGRRTVERVLAGARA